MEGKEQSQKNKKGARVRGQTSHVRTKCVKKKRTLEEGRMIHNKVTSNVFWQVAVGPVQQREAQRNESKIDDRRSRVRKGKGKKNAQNGRKKKHDYLHCSSPNIVC